jgi:voltage-gated potassium channel
VVGWKRLLRGGALVVAAVVLYFVVPVGAGADHAVLGQGVVSLVIIAAAGAVVLWQVVRQVDEPDRPIDGLVLSIVLGVLVFALSFYRLHLEDADAFAGLSTRVDSLYFTVSTLLTVGYGDIHAESQWAEVLVLLQMVFNVAVIATAVSTLTTRVRENAARRAATRRQARDGSADD